MSELVERSGTAAATVRYYLAEGLLPAPTRAQANRYLYDERHVEIVRFIRLLRDRRGLSLEEIRRLLPELLPDLLDSPSGGVFRPEMFSQLIAGFTAAHSTGPTVTEQLVDAGLSAFSARGFAEVSVDDICRAVKIAKGSFYRHFTSKEDLFIAVTQRIPALFAGALIGGAPIDVAIQPNLTTLLELASLASRDRRSYRNALASLLDGLAAALVDAGASPDESSAEQMLAGYLGCVVMVLGGRGDSGDSTEAP
jgi:AcrR family transcriptional regulator